MRVIQEHNTFQTCFVLLLINSKKIWIVFENFEKNKLFLFLTSSYVRQATINQTFKILEKEDIIFI